MNINNLFEDGQPGVAAPRRSRRGVQARGRGEDEGDQRGLRLFPQEV